MDDKFYYHSRRVCFAWNLLRWSCPRFFKFVQVCPICPILSNFVQFCPCLFRLVYKRTKTKNYACSHFNTNHAIQHNSMQATKLVRTSSYKSRRPKSYSTPKYVYLWLHYALCNMQYACNCRRTKTKYKSHNTNDQTQFNAFNATHATHWN